MQKLLKYLNFIKILCIHYPIEIQVRILRQNHIYYQIKTVYNKYVYDFV